MSISIESISEEDGTLKDIKKALEEITPNHQVLFFTISTVEENGEGTSDCAVYTNINDLGAAALIARLLSKSSPVVMELVDQFMTQNAAHVNHIPKDQVVH